MNLTSPRLPPSSEGDKTGLLRNNTFIYTSEYYIYIYIVYSCHYVYFVTVYKTSHDLKNTCFHLVVFFLRKKIASDFLNFNITVQFDGALKLIINWVVGLSGEKRFPQSAGVEGRRLDIMQAVKDRKIKDKKRHGEISISKSLPFFFAVSFEYE